MSLKSAQNRRYGVRMILRMPILAGVMAVALLMAGEAGAQSLKDARARESHMAALGEQVVYTRKVCDSGLRAEIDWTSAGDWQMGLLVRECDKALGALEAACRAGEARAKSVTRFICAGDGAGARLAGASLRYGAARGADAFKETQTALAGR